MPPPGAPGPREFAGAARTEQPGGQDKPARPTAAMTASAAAQPRPERILRAALRRWQRFQCGPHPVNNEGVVDLPFSMLLPPLHHLLSTLHDGRCRTPCKTRFRLAGCAFAGRESNPLDRYERFQFIASSSPGLRLAQYLLGRGGMGQLRTAAEMVEAPCEPGWFRRLSSIYSDSHPAPERKPDGGSWHTRQVKRCLSWSKKHTQSVCQ